MSSNGHRSNSVAASVRSRKTLVGNDPDLTANNESMSDDTYEAVTYHAPKYIWVDHLLRMFCVKLSSKTLPINRKEHVKSKTPEGSEICNSPSTWPSPWIVPVHVVSNRQDTDRHPITKIAKCTIDTGNMQGNIVSREFVEKVLEFPSSGFRKLTQEEEMGGTGITGDSHIPQGAIYLTWYHKNSTKVFRDMRFLISPAQHCDLIIGAWSIQKDKIVNVPCLPVGSKVAVDPTNDPESQELNTTLHKNQSDLNRAIARRKKIEGKDHFSEIPELDRKITVLQNEVTILDCTVKIYNLTYKNDRTEAESQLLVGLWKELESTFQSDKMKKLIDHLQKQVGNEPGHEKKSSSSDSKKRR